MSWRSIKTFRSITWWEQSHSYTWQSCYRQTPCFLLSWTNYTLRTTHYWRQD